MHKLGSLFDGSGTCPLTAALCGIMPVWASEIEKFPIQVTSARFPDMKHLGDITKINGAEIEPVDVITFGSPCTNLSVAGKQNGFNITFMCFEDDAKEPHFNETIRATDKVKYLYEMTCPVCGKRLTATNESALFFNAIRVITEMREATNGEYPRFIMWENVPGAFSSNKGADFRTVLEEIAQAEIPMPDGKWATAGMVELPECQIAWRVLDAQYWGVPQRRKRIFLVADFRGECAGEVLFKPESLFGDFTQSGEAREGVITDTERGVGSTGALPINLQIATRHNALGEGTGLGIGKDGDPAFTLQEAHSHGVAVLRMREGCAGGGKGPLISNNKSLTLATNNDQVLITAGFMAGQGAKAGGIGCKEEISPTLKSVNSGGNTIPSIVTYPTVTGTLCASGAGLNRPAGQGNEKDLCIVHEQAFSLNGFGGFKEGIGTLRANGGNNGDGSETLVTHTLGSGKECTGPIMASCAEKQFLGNQEALSGDYHIIAQKTVRRLTPTECARLQGFPDWWASDILHSDSAEYKMWGNGMALPCVLYIMQNIKTALT